MPLIKFLKNFPDIPVRNRSNLMKSLLASGRPVASSCGGDGVCAKCKIRIIEGSENLTSPMSSETERLKTNNIPLNYRLSCQTQVIGDIVIDADYW
jgi:2Fe-2S ferredoxin